MLAVVICATFPLATIAQGPKLPANLNQPTTASAIANTVNGKLNLTLKVVETVIAKETRTVTEYVPVKKTENGKEIIVAVPVTKQIEVTVAKPASWREVKLAPGAEGISVVDTAGKPVSAELLAKRLQKESPVLVSTSGPVDPFFLQTVKDDTLIFLVPAEIMYLVPKPVTLPATPAKPE
jgi:hypothetical protein